MHHVIFGNLYLIYPILDLKLGITFRIKGSSSQSLINLFWFMFQRAIIRWVISTITITTFYFLFSASNLFRTFIKLMSFFSTILTVNSFQSMWIISNNCEFFCFFSLLNNCVYHSASHFKLLIVISGQKYMQWLIHSWLFLCIWTI